MSKVIPVILCGGSGTRLWPLSRSNRPKQLISLTGDHSLLEATLLRAMTIAGSGELLCVTAAAYEAEVRQSLDRLGLGGRLIVELEGRNTAPALTAAALVAMPIDREAIIVALPADHVIDEGEAFAEAIAFACKAAAQGWLAILGVSPRHASSAVGYIMPGAAIDGLPHVIRVNRFVEKPEEEMARDLIEAGALWNSGIVVARADTAIEAMKKFEPAVLEAVERSLANGQSSVNGVRLGSTDFARAPRISFDKAVLERHGSVAVAKLDAAWRDVGTWAEVAELFPDAGDGNRQKGKVHLTGSRDTFVFSPGRLTVGIGLKDLIVVDTPDALLIVNRSDLGLMGDVVAAMTAAHYPEVAAGEDRIHAKRILIDAGESIVLPPHDDPMRHCIVTRGTFAVRAGNKTSNYKQTESFCVPPGVPHTIGNEGPAEAELIEVRCSRDFFNTV
jgi:mannose-1-phosphate guanylyltransferase / mannose-6-phosphate isomerase